MKQTYLLALLFFSSLLSAQNVNIPDANFKHILVNSLASHQIAATDINYAFGAQNYVKVDTNNDGEISYSEASQLAYLSIGGFFYTVADFTGIEAFINLKVLSITNNNSSIVDLSQNTQLIKLTILDSNVSSINIDNLDGLKILDCQNNNLSTLNLSTNINIEKLWCGGNQLASLDITSLASLNDLSCASNNLTTLDVTQNLLLERIYATGNEITNIDVSQNAILLDLTLRSNNLSTIDVSNNLILSNLELSYNMLTDIDVTQNLSLKGLNIFKNFVSDIDITQNVALIGLSCSYNLLTDIDVTQNLALKNFLCSNNELLVLDVTQNQNLLKLDYSNTGLPSVDISQNPLLVTLKCAGNEVTILDFTNNGLLEILDCNQNNLANINLQQIPFLKELDCSKNQITSLDLSQHTLLSKISCRYNPITYLNVKNGITQQEVNTYGCANLFYICADEGQIGYLQTRVESHIVVGSYCDFVPGGNHNTTTGTFKYDLDDNGCDISDSPFRFIPLSVSLNGAVPNSKVYGNSVGKYNFFSSTVGSYTLTPTLANPAYFSINPSSIDVTNTIIDNSLVVENFCVTANGIHPDLEVILIPLTVARPGDDASYHILCRNIGNQIIPATIGLTFNDAVLDFISASNVPTSIIGSTLQWEVETLMPFQQKNIVVTFNINTPQEIPAVNIDDILNFTAFVNTLADDNLADNTFSVNQTVVESFDPNDITCLQGNLLPINDIGTYLHYNIRFENTGTAAAQNVVVKNTIDLLQYDIQSLRVLESSHPVAIKVTGNVAEFIFEGINLDPEVQGNVLYKIQTKAVLANNEVKNKAEIYFDYNFPIITNDELTVFSTLSNSDFSKDSSLQIYPNPAQDFLNVNSENTITSIQLYDSQGRLLTTKVANDTSEVLDISTYAKGIYFVSVMTSVGKKTQKIIKK